MPRLNAEHIARALGGRRSGAQWTARCPAHDDTTPSLSLRDATDGRVLFHCHAGCAQSDVIAAIRERGLWTDSDAGPDRCEPPQMNDASNKQSREDRARTIAALRRWSQSTPAASSLVETYLRSRGISVALPSTLKFHPALPHPTGSTHPAMIGLVADGTSNKPTGVHRTYLADDGLHKADVKPNKMMLGPCRGGAVRLGAASSPLLIGEGIETCLSAMQATGHSAWAALSASGMRALALPDHVREVVILADGDEPGVRAAAKAANRFAAERRRVRIAQAPTGTDFNDLLRGGALRPNGGTP